MQKHTTKPRNMSAGKIAKTAINIILLHN